MNISQPKGWIKLYTKTLYSDLWQDQTAWRIFEALLCMAHYEDDFTSVRFAGKQRYLKRGELEISRSELAGMLSIPTSTVRNALDRLDKDNRITIESDRHNTIISICNWKKYQPTEAERKAGAKDNKRTTGGQLEDNQTDTKRYKEIKNIDVYEKNSELNKAFNEFIEHRKLLKKPMTDLAIRKMVNELERLAPGNDSDKIAILNQSILHGWIGVFGLKDGAKEKRFA